MDLVRNRRSETKPLDDEDCQAAFVLALTRVSPNEAEKAEPTIAQLVDRALLDASEHAQPTNEKFIASINQRRKELLAGEIESMHPSSIEAGKFDLNEIRRRRLFIRADLENCVSKLELHAIRVSVLTAQCAERCATWLSENSIDKQKRHLNDPVETPENPFTSIAEHTITPRNRTRSIEIGDIGEAMAAIQKDFIRSGWLPIPSHFNGHAPSKSSGLRYDLDSTTTLRIREDKHGVIRSDLVDAMNSNSSPTNPQAPNLNQQAISAWRQFFESRLAFEARVLAPSVVQQILNESGLKFRKPSKGHFEIRDGDSALRLREDAGTIELAGSSQCLNHLFDTLEHKIEATANKCLIAESFRLAMESAGVNSGIEMGLSAARFGRYQVALGIQAETFATSSSRKTGRTDAEFSTTDASDADSLTASVYSEDIEPPVQHTLKDTKRILFEMAREAGSYLTDLGRAAVGSLTTSTVVSTGIDPSVSGSQAKPDADTSHHHHDPSQTATLTHEEIVSTYREVEKYLAESQALFVKHQDAKSAKVMRKQMETLSYIQAIAQKYGLTIETLETPKSSGSAAARGEVQSTSKKPGREL